MAPLARGGVCAFKISSIESHPVRFPRLPADETLAILEASVETGLPVGLHNEDQEIVRASAAALKRAGRTTPDRHEPSRPLAADWETFAVRVSATYLRGRRVRDGTRVTGRPGGGRFVRRSPDPGAPRHA